MSKQKLQGSKFVIIHSKHNADSVLNAFCPFLTPWIL
jgi:hypothetical protein